MFNEEAYSDDSEKQRSQTADNGRKSRSRSSSVERSWRGDTRKVENNSNKSKREVCRNFLNNRCNRGSNCKYDHPPNESSKNKNLSSSRKRSRSPNHRAQVCRDFLHNDCNRGKQCKFYHPEKEQPKQESWLSFCLDYKNNRCSRPMCRLVLLKYHLYLRLDHIILILVIIIVLDSMLLRFY